MTTDRAEFERRLLALVRSYLDEADALYPEGYDIGEFIVLYEVFTRVSDTEQLDPWSGGPRAGYNSAGIAWSSTTNQYWLGEALLAEAHERVRRMRFDDGEVTDSLEGEATGSDEADE